MLTIPVNNNSALAEMYDIEAGVLAALRGEPHKMICAAIGLSQRQYSHWRMTDPIFKTAIDRARAEGHEWVADSVLTIVDDNEGLSPQSIKIKFDAICKWLAWMDPAKYGDKLQVKTEYVDLRSALSDAKTRIIDVTSSPAFDLFEE